MPQRFQAQDLLPPALSMEFDCIVVVVEELRPSWLNWKPHLRRSRRKRSPWERTRSLSRPWPRSSIQE